MDITEVSRVFLPFEWPLSVGRGEVWPKMNIHQVVPIKELQGNYSRRTFPYQRSHEMDAARNTRQEILRSGLRVVYHLLDVEHCRIIVNSNRHGVAACSC